MRPGPCTDRKSYDSIWEFVLKEQMLKLTINKLSRENRVGGQNLEYERVFGTGHLVWSLDSKSWERKWKGIVGPLW